MTLPPTPESGKHEPGHTTAALAPSLPHTLILAPVGLEAPLVTPGAANPPAYDDLWEPFIWRLIDSFAAVCHDLNELDHLARRDDDHPEPEPEPEPAPEPTTATLARNPSCDVELEGSLIWQKPLSGLLRPCVTRGVRRGGLTPALQRGAAVVGGGRDGDEMIRSGTARVRSRLTPAPGQATPRFRREFEALYLHESQSAPREGGAVTGAGLSQGPGGGASMESSLPTSTK